MTESTQTEMKEIKPEGERTKAEEWEACYAALFNQLNPVMEQNASLLRQYQKLREAVEEWQDILSAPKSKAILVYYKNSNGKDRVIKARFISKFTEENSEEWAEYNEEKDEYYTPEGWYEMIDNWDEYESVKMYETPTHWQPLPSPPTISGESTNEQLGEK